MSWDLPRGMTYEYRVTYRRHGWTQSQSRIYQHQAAAERFAAKLNRDPLDDLAPMEYVRLERRPVPMAWHRVPNPYGVRARRDAAEVTR